MADATRRIGIGHDVHKLVSGRPLWLGCLEIADADVGLLGHSDADVVAHAVCDALLGAAALGDIGDHFPDNDPVYKDIAGSVLLGRVAAMIGDAACEIENIDVTVMSDAVRLGPLKKKMAAAMAKPLGVDTDQVNVKATTFEGMGAVGRGEVIACEAVALLKSRG